MYTKFCCWSVAAALLGAAGGCGDSNSETTSGNSATGGTRSVTAGTGAVAGTGAGTAGVGALPIAGTGAVSTSGTGTLPIAGTGVVPIAGTSGGAGSGAVAGASGGTEGASGAAGVAETVGTGEVSGTGGRVAGAPAEGGSGAAVGGSGGTDSGCPAQYTVATQIAMDVTWSGTLALNAGSGKVYIWTRSAFDESAQPATVESMSCGTVLPVITTTAVAGSVMILPEIPDAAWDSPMMPKFAGTATRSGSMLSIDSGIALIGLTLQNPNGAWPSASSIMGLDQDGDGRAGITAIPRDGGGFSPPPTSLAQTQRADKLDLVIRNAMTLMATAEGCPDSYSGSADVSHFDNHVIGCHVKGGADCTPAEQQFVDEQRTVFIPGTATFMSKTVPDGASCADVRAALPMP
jgi:hypothetical protein